MCTYHLELEWSTTSCNVCHLIFRSDLHLIFLESGILSALTVRVGGKKKSVVSLKPQGSKELELKLVVQPCESCFTELLLKPQSRIGMELSVSLMQSNIHLFQKKS